MQPIKKGKNLLLLLFFVLTIIFVVIFVNFNSKSKADVSNICDDGLALTEDTLEIPLGDPLNTPDSGKICFHTYNQPIRSCYNKPYSSLDRNGDLLNQVNLLMAETDSIVLKNNNRLVLKIVKRDALEKMCGVANFTRNNVNIKDIPDGSVQVCQDKIKNYLLSFTNDQSPNQSFNGISIDEFIESIGTNYRNYNQAVIGSLKLYKQAAPTKMLVGWGPRLFDNMVSDTDNNNQIDTFKYLDYFIPEIYLNDGETDLLINTKIDNTIYGSSDDIGLAGVYAKLASRAKTINPLVPYTRDELIAMGIAKKRILASFGSYNLPYKNDYDLDPNSSLNELYDLEFFNIKEKFAANKNANGVAIWDCERTDVQVAAWLADLFNHYYADVPTGMDPPPSPLEFSNKPRALTYLLNGGFESGLDNWNIAPGTGGTINTKTAVGSPTENGLKFPLENSTAKVPQPTTVNAEMLHFTRGSSVNKAEQQLHDLVPGNKYKLEVYHFRQPTESTIPKQFLESNITTKLKFYISGVDFSWDFYDKRGYILYEKGYVNGQEVDSYNWYVEEFIFTAPANVVDHPLKISISDESASPDQEHYVDFVQLQDKNTTAEIFGCKEIYNWATPTWAGSQNVIHFMVRAKCLKVSNKVTFRTSIPNNTTLVANDSLLNPKVESEIQNFTIDIANPSYVNWTFDNLGTNKSFSVLLDYYVKVR